MELKTVVAKPETYTCDALVIGLFENQPVPELAKPFDAALNNSISKLLESKDFVPELGSMKNLTTLGKLPAKNILLVGLGKQEDCTLETLRRIAGLTTKVLRENNNKHIATTLQQLAVSTLEQRTQAITEVLVLAQYQFTQFKTVGKEKIKSIQTITLLTTEQDKIVVENTARVGSTIATNVNLARELVDLPPMIATPHYIAAKAQECGKQKGFSATVLSKTDLENLGCNALLAVGKGSVREPCMVILEYGDKKIKPIAVIGKGVTFDTGGMNLKPTGHCETMKTDMAGAANVLAIIATAADLKLPVHLVGALPLCENMISGSCYLPGDILTAYNKKTIEILNTDAEGRVILADALAYVEKNHAPELMVDFATLTGACIVALGNHAAGLFGSDDKLLGQLKNAGETSGERLWQFPLWNEYMDMVKSDVADVRNIGKPDRHAGAITGAAFLKNFVEKTPWAHVDIAGPSHLDDDFWHLSRGATGFGIRMFVEFLRAKK